MAGINANVKRSKANNIGGMCPSANLMTTKFVPHTKTTAKASRKWRTERLFCIGYWDVAGGCVANRCGLLARDELTPCAFHVASEYQ